MLGALLFPGTSRDVSCCSLTQSPDCCPGHTLLKDTSCYLSNMTSSSNSSSGVYRLGIASRCCSLVLPLALAAVLTLAPTASAAGGAARFQKPYNVCTSDWAPIVSPYLAAANVLEQQWGCQH
jgi:hypothetical protein